MKHSTKSYFMHENEFHGIKEGQESTGSIFGHKNSVTDNSLGRRLWLNEGIHC